MARETAFENGTISFDGACDIDLDLESGHTAYRRASLIGLYLHAKFHRNWRNFLLIGRQTQLNALPMPATI